MYVSAQDQIIHDAHYSSHGTFNSSICPIWTRKFDCLAIAQKSSRKKLIVYVKRRGFQVVGLHCVLPYNGLLKDCRALGLLYLMRDWAKFGSKFHHVAAMHVFMRKVNNAKTDLTRTKRGHVSIVYDIWWKQTGSCSENGMRVPI